MQIDAISLREVGPFRAPAAITGFAPGLNVLAGPNELGKSTLFRALKILFTEAYSARNERIRNLQPYSGGAPFISCDFLLDGTAWSLSKQYLAGKSAELRERDGRRVYRAGDVETALADLLSDAGIANSAFDLLWVAQGDSFKQPSTDPQTRQTMADLIREAAEVVSGGAELLAVHDLVTAQLDTLITKKSRKPKAGGAYDIALKQRDALHAALQTAQEKHAASSERQQQLHEARQQLTELQNPKVHRTTNEKIDELQSKLERTEIAQRQIALLDERINRLKAAETTVTTTLNDYLSAKKERDNHTTKRNHLRSASTEIEQAIGSTQVAQLAASDQLNQLTDRRDKLQEMKVAAERAARRHHLDLQATGLAKRLSDAKTAAQQFAGDRLKLDAITITETSFRELQRHANNLAAAEARLDATAPRIEISYEAGRQDGILLDGANAPNGRQISVERPVKLSIPRIGEILIAPGQTLGEGDPVTERNHARKTYTDMIADCAVETFDDAETAIAIRRQLSQALDRQDALLTNLAPEGICDLEDTLTKLKVELAEIPTNPASEDIRFDETTWQATMAALKSAEKDVMAHQNAAAELREQLAKSAAELTACETRLCALAKRVPTEVADQEKLHRELTANVDLASETLNSSLRERAALQDGAPGPEVIKDTSQELHDLKASQLSRATQIAHLREQAQALEGALNRDVEDGMESNIQNLIEQCQAAESRVAGFEHDVAALNLLDQELASARANRGQAVTGPLSQHITDLAQQILPQTHFEFDETLTVKRIERNKASETLSTLSDGTREQIAVLARLAMANILREGGRTVPIILDDALVYSDDRRLAALFTALAHTAQKSQVILLTCHARSFQPLITEHKGCNLSLRNETVST